MSTVILMDVDGVILPQAVKPDGAVDVLHAWARPEVIEFLHEVTTTPGVRFEWLSTWGADVRELEHALGLAPQDYHERPRRLPAGHWWKQGHAFYLADFFPEHTIIWCDDAITGDAGEIERGTNDLTHPFPNLHMVSPNHTRGLTRGHMDTIRQLIKETQ